MGLLAGGSLIPDQGFNLKRTIWNFITGFHPFPSAHYNKEVFEGVYQYMLKKKVKFLRGYPTSVLSFAEYVKSSHGNFPLEAIYTTAEVLQPPHRKLIEEVFQTRIFDQYGCADSGGHASECGEEPGYHISFETSICEFINPESNYDGEEIAELLFTNLHNYTMPLLRYAPGDLASIQKEPCSCGRETDRIKRIIGRTTERIKFSNGHVLAGPAFTLFFRNFSVKNYQLEQVAHDKLFVNLVRAEGFQDERDIPLIKENLSHHAGPGVSIEVKFMDSIGTSSSGKHRFIIALKDL
jgi:phenylacetate-CoA ligase